MELRGPIEDGTWSEQLSALVVDRDGRVHGYDVVGDLAQHYGFAEIVLTTLVGETPSRAVGRAFAVVMAALLPIGIARGASHGTSLARMLGTPPRSTVAIAAALLAETADELVSRHAPLLVWLDRAEGDPPAIALTDDAGERLRAQALVQALGEAAAICPAISSHPFTRDATVVAILFACGLRNALTQVTAMVVAATSAVVAEAALHPPKALREYPIDVPAFRYREPEDDGR